MRRIVSGPTGIRYRTTDDKMPWSNGPFVPVLVEGVVATIKTPQEAHRDDAECVVLEELPRIPDWPLPGLAPQFLTDDGFADEVGDMIVEHFPHIETEHRIGQWRIYTVKAAYAGWNTHWSKVSGAPCRRYLVSHANPEDDAL